MLCRPVLDEKRKRLINAGGNTAGITDKYQDYISKKLTPNKLIRYSAAGETSRKRDYLIAKKPSKHDHLNTVRMSTKPARLKRSKLP